MLSVSFVTMPLTHYAITEANRKLHNIYIHIAPPEPLIIHFSLGNHIMHELIDVFNLPLLFGFVVAYAESTNTLSLSTESIGAGNPDYVALEIGSSTTYGGLIGIRAGDTSVLESYAAPDGVGLA